MPKFGYFLALSKIAKKSRGRSCTRPFNCTGAERELLALPVRMGGMGLINLSQTAALEYAASANISGPLAHQIKSQ